jgi:hypothetical protein
MFSGRVELIQNIWSFIKTLGRLGFLLRPVKIVQCGKPIYYGPMQTA